MKSLRMQFLKGRSRRISRSKGIGGGRVGIGKWIVLAGIAAFGERGVAGLEPSDILVHQLGPVSIRPQLGVMTEFNDNILYREEDKDWDLINVISPGVRFLLGEDLPTANRLLFQYTLDQSWHLDHRELDATQHRLELSGRYSTGRTTITGRDQLQFLSSALGGGFSSAGVKVDRTVFSDLYRVDYRVGERTEVYAEAEHSATDYQGDINLFDVRTIAGTLGFQWGFSEDTRFFGEAYYGITQVENNVGTVEPPGRTFVGGFVGARGTFTEKLTGMVKAGYEATEFEESANFGAESSSSSAPVVESSLSYQITDKTSLSLTYSRRQRVSVEFFQAGYTADDVMLSANAALGHTGRLRANAAVFFGMYDYEESPAFAERTDTRWGFSTGVSWYFQTWLFTRLQYDFSQYASDFSTLVDYAQNRVMISAGVGY